MVLTAEQHHPNIKIFVSAHKQATLPEGKSILPVQVGAANAAIRFANTLHDDEGENISAKNPRYCELTAQYWAWKNEDADYYGFCHYRRYFDFTDTPHKENDYGEIIDSYIDDHALAEYGINDEAIARAVDGWDVITTPLNDVRRIGGFSNLKQHWDADEHLRLKDLRHMYDILCTRHPDYKVDADAVLNGRTAAFCNMFIMRKEIFFEYNEWLFPLLDEFADATDFSKMDVQTTRTVGHLSERLLNIFIAHKQRTGAHWKIKRMQCVHFLRPDPMTTLEPLGTEYGRVVPVVFAADNNYVPMLATTIYSMLKNASMNRSNDVIELERDITGENQRYMERFFAQFPNPLLRREPLSGRFQSHHQQRAYQRRNVLPFHHSRGVAVLFEAAVLGLRSGGQWRYRRTVRY